MHRAATWLPSGASVAGSRHWLDQHEPELVVSVGRVGLTRAVTALLARAKHHLVIDRTSRWADPGRTASAVLIGSVPIPPPRTSNPDGTRPRDDGSPWLRQWRSAAQAASDRIDEMLEAEHMLCGLHVAREVWRTAPDDSLLFLAASWPIRQVYLTARPRPGLRVLANRGANGIDGVVSSSWGAAVAHREDIGGPTTALIGDLAFLHDSNGLIVPAQEDRPPLRLVVLDNNGGGIFSQLEQAAPAFEQDFERVFGTPHGLHLVGRSRLCGVPARGISEREALGEALAAEVPGTSVVVAEVADRASEAELMRQMQAEVAGAIAGA
jgi:2-succinyl-5-enolpyruvyl-6-hydroxy-3-cyclohexene-1-carboxylate synthase